MDTIELYRVTGFTFQTTIFALPSGRRERALTQAGSGSMVLPWQIYLIAMVRPEWARLIA